MVTATQWSTRAYQSSDEGDVLKLLKASLGDDSHGASEGVWQWKHISNPFGQSFLRVAANAEDTAIGLRAFMQWGFHANGRQLRAVRAVDTATHPNFQRMGIFNTLTLQVVEEAEQDGVDLIFNTPNQFSMPGYLKMGWRHVGTVQPMVRVLNKPRFFYGLLRSRLSKSTRPPYSPESFFKSDVTRVGDLIEHSSDMERLVSTSEALSRQGDTISTSRSVDYLRWRYAQHPHIPYYALTVEANGSLKGCAIFRLNTRFGLKEALLCEVLLDEDDEKLYRALVNKLRSSLKADYFIAYSREGSFLHRAFRRSGFRPVPRQGMNLTVRPLNPDLPVDPMRLQSWALSLGDLELF